MLADRIREFSYKHFILPAVQAGRIECCIRAGDVHRSMGLQNRMPAVCSALQSAAFRDNYGLRLGRREGPLQGANARYCFQFLAEGPVRSTTTERLLNTPSPMAPRLPTNLSSPTLCLVSCVSRKRATAAPAADLYESEWFRRAKRYVESLKCPWFILSAKYGLIEPDRIIEPYDETLNMMGVAERRAWAERVRIQMDSKLPQASIVIVLAGERYREFLMDYLRKRAREVRVPLEGLRIGEQVSHLGKGRS